MRSVLDTRCATPRPRPWRAVAFITTLAVATSCATEEPIDLRIAVASNFADAMTRLADEFETATGKKVTLSFGSTGKHYAQIVNGAPYDLFFAADAERPKLLEDEDVAVAGSRLAYARGRLVLWSPIEGLVDSDGRVLADPTVRFIAIANPDLAPYGRAAKEVLQALRLWDALNERLVRGENISQSFHFVQSGNADVGFVAYSQVMRQGRPIGGSLWVIPDSLYAPIEQEALILKDGETARSFMAFVRSEDGVRIIRDSGYDIP